MSNDHPTRVGIAGTGPLALALAETCARRGCDVLLLDAPETRPVSDRRLDSVFAQQTRRTPGARDAVAQSRARIQHTSDLDRMETRQFVFDTRPVGSAEDLDRVARLEAALTDLASVLLATSSTLPVSAVAASTAHPWRVLGARLLVPVPALPLMELVTGELTRPKVAFRTASFVTSVLGKSLIHSEETPVFSEDAMPIADVLSAMRLLESRPGAVDDLHLAPLPGCNRPIGALEFADMLGLDTLRSIVEELYAEHPHPHYEVPASLDRIIEQGHLGRKTGRGFFRYPACDGLAFNVVAVPSMRSRPAPARLAM